MTGGGLGGNHDNGYILNPVAGIHDLQHLEAAHFRHNDIQQDQVDVRAVSLEGGQSLQAVFRFNNFIAVLQHIRQDGPVHLGVIRN